MNRTFFLTILLLTSFPSLHVFAQDNFVPGTVINSKGDTLQGLINDRRWYNSPTKIEFKKSDGTIQNYKPEDLKGFQIKDKSTYLSCEVSYDSTSIDVDKMPTAFQPAFKKDHVLLKYVVKSNLSLLTFEENDRLHLFVQQGKVVEELIYHQFRTHGSILENKSYIPQLQKYFSDCASMSVSTKEPYNTRSISNLFMKYNECGNNKTETFKKKDKTIVNPGITTFVALDQFHPNFNGGMGYGAGGFLNLSFPNNNYGVSLYNEVIYRTIGKQSNTSSTLVYSGLKSVQLSSIIRWRLIPSFSRLLLGGGIAFSKGVNYSEDPTLVKIDLAIVADMCLKVGAHGLVDLRFLSEDAVTDNMDQTRSTSLRLSFGWKF